MGSLGACETTFRVVAIGGILVVDDLGIHSYVEVKRAREAQVGHIVGIKWFWVEEQISKHVISR